MRFGIPTQLLPMDDNGKPFIHTFERYLQEQQNMEQQKEQTTIAIANNGSMLVEYPTKFDVLLGRGIPYQSVSCISCTP